MNIFINVQALCKSSGISILSLEKAIGLHDNTIGKWKTSVPNIASVIKVADYFNISLDTLVGRTVQQTSISNGNGIVANGTVSNSGNNSNNNNFSQNNNQCNNLSEIETELISTCRKMDTRKKTALLTYAYGLEKE